MPLDHTDQLDALANELQSAERVLFITGAGISAESGLPTYRGVGGLYNDSDTEDGVPVEMALAGQMLRDDPALCWKYLLQVGRACAQATHNRAHELIVEMEAHFPHVCTLTQNIDGYHRVADTRILIEIHGSNRSLLCTHCGWRGPAPAYASGYYDTLPPKCDICGGILRPEVVLFGEMLPQQAIERLHIELSEPFDCVFTIGTTSVFPYIAQPVLINASAGRTTVEINPAHSEVSDLVRYRFQAGAVETLEALWSRLKK